MKSSAVIAVIAATSFMISCSGAQVSETSTTTTTSTSTTSTTEVLGTTTSPETTLPLIPTSLISKTFSEGPTTFTLKYGVGNPYSITDPDTETESECPLEQLPSVGTTYQYLYFEIEIPGSRRFQLPSIELGIVWDDFGTERYQSFGQNSALSGFLDSSQVCIPTQFSSLMISEETGIFSAIASDGRGGLYLDNTADAKTRQVGRILVTTEWASTNKTNPRPVILVRESSMGLTPFFGNQNLLTLAEYAQYVGPSTIIFLDGQSPDIQSDAQAEYQGQDVCDRFYSPGETKGLTCSVMAAGMPNPKTMAELINFCTVVVSPNDRGLCTEERLSNE
jgi:hypothetical protein